MPAVADGFGSWALAGSAGQRTPTAETISGFSLGVRLCRSGSRHPGAIFKAEFGEAIRQAGLIEGASFLSKEDRQVAVGLAINWGMRLLLAYAVETPRRRRSSKRKDLTWLGGRVGPAIAERT